MWRTEAGHTISSAHDYLITEAKKCKHELALFHSGVRGDKVSMLSHEPTQTPEETLKSPYAITRLTAHFMCGLMSDLVQLQF